MLPFGIHKRAQPAAIAAAWLCLFDATAHASALMPRQTNTAGSPTPVVVDFPFAATPAPVLPEELRRRQLNTICGYIGGNADLPATCSAGSHCVAEMNKGVIGCCPDSGPCTTGIFTACADTNNPPKGGDPFVFTCGAGQVCYKNSYDGGFSQFGCGSASDLATSVATKVAGQSAVILGTVSGSEAAAPSASPTGSSAGSSASSSAAKSAGSSETSSVASSAASGASSSASASAGASSGSSSGSSSATRAKSSAASSTSSAALETSSVTDQSSTSDSEATASSSTESAAPRPTPITNGIPAGTSVSQSGSPNTQGPDVDGTAKTNTAAIIGGVLGGISGLIIIVALILFIRRNKRIKDNERRSPSAQGSFISRPYVQGENGMNGDDAYGTSLSSPPRPAPAPPMSQAAMGERWPLANRQSRANNAAPVGRPGSSMYSDNVPLTMSSQEFAPAPVTRDVYAPPGAAMMDAPPPPRRSGNSPLWQQNRYDR